LNATYIVSVARKLGCSVFLLPEDIVEVKNGIKSSETRKQHTSKCKSDVFKCLLLQVNQKMILILTASIMYWSLQQQSSSSESSSSSSDSSSTHSTTTTCTSTCTSTDASPAPSVTGEDEVSSLNGEVSSLTIEEDNEVSSLTIEEDNDADILSDITSISEEAANE